MTKQKILAKQLSIKNGFSMLEPLLASVILAIITAGTALMLISANRLSQNADVVDNSEWNINTDLSAIQRLSRRFTCCSGSCLVQIPTNYGSTKSCAVNNPDDDRYFYPQLDDTSTTTINEPNAVDALCNDSNNATFMTPLKTAVDATASPSGIIRTTTIKPDHALEISYSDSANNQVRRVSLIVPPMAFWCP
jgi:type II secretory pathway pseudopilin PulG